VTKDNAEVEWATVHPNHLLVPTRKQPQKMDIVLNQNNSLNVASVKQQYIANAQKIRARYEMS